MSSLFVITLCLMLLWLLRPAPMPAVGEAGVAPEASHTAGTIVVDLQDDTPLSEIEAFERRYGVDLEYSSAWSEDEALLHAEVPDVAAALAAMAGDPLIEVAEPEVEMHMLGYPDDPHWDKQWNMRMIGVEEAWRVGAGAACAWPCSTPASAWSRTSPRAASSRASPSCRA
ncbi:MAG: hypothetical protein H6741_04080 [Alphaproteobacteria bacterium]|nr:hypothetical protein [Alphaproteobacteria bacterium]